VEAIIFAAYTVQYASWQSCIVNSRTSPMCYCCYAELAFSSLSVGRAYAGIAQNYTVQCLVGSFYCRCTLCIV